MERRIRIKTGAVELAAELNNTSTARAVWEALPIRGKASRWGDEVYFTTPLSLELEDGQEVVAAGDIGYWPTGRALCIFFGPTPMSQGDEIRPASAVTVLGRVVGDAGSLRGVSAGAEIVIEREG